MGIRRPSCFGAHYTVYRNVTTNVAAPADTYAARFNVLNSDVYPATPTANPRAQVSSSTFLAPGTTVWESWSVYFPTDFPDVPSGGTNNFYLFQEDYGPPYNGSPPLGFDIANISGVQKMTLSRGAQYSYDTIWTTTLTKGQWYSFLVHKKFAMDATGFIEFWLNGVKQTFTDGSTLKNTQTMHSDATGNYQIYLNSYRLLDMWTGAVVMYHGPAKVGNTQASVAPIGTVYYDGRFTTAGTYQGLLDNVNTTSPAPPWGSMESIGGSNSKTIVYTTATKTAGWPDAAPWSTFAAAMTSYNDGTHSTIRTQVSGGSGNTDVVAGLERWYGFKVYIPSTYGFPGSSGFQGIWQMHASPYNGSPATNIGLRTGSPWATPGADGVKRIRWQTPGGWSLWEAPCPLDQWFDVVVHIIYNTNPTLSTVEIWLNGVQQTFTHTGTEHSEGTNYVTTGANLANGGLTAHVATMLNDTNDVGSAYLQNYRNGSGSALGTGAQTLFHSGMKVGSSYAAVDPSVSGGGTATTPANTAAPVISGTPAVGSSLTASTGTWSNTPTSYAYQWKRAGTAISGATASTYTVVSGDVGQALTVTVTASNTAGSASATSASVTATSASWTYAQGVANPTSIPSATTGATIAQAFTTNPTAGSLLTALVSWDGTGARTATVTDNVGGTWVQSTGSPKLHTSDNQYASLWYCLSAVGGATTVTATFSAAIGFRSIQIDNWTPPSTPITFDVGAAAFGTSTTATNGFSSGANTTTAVGDLVVGFVMNTGTPAVVTAGTGFTLRQSQPTNNSFSEDQVQTSAGSIAATFTRTASTETYIAFMAAFKA